MISDRLDKIEIYFLKYFMIFSSLIFMIGVSATIIYSIKAANDIANYYRMDINNNISRLVPQPEEQVYPPPEEQLYPVIY
jgi:hypothetical protein